MNKQRMLIYGLVLAILIALVYVQFRQWRTFDWNKLIEHSRGIAWQHVIYGIVLIYIAYFLRAVRWKIFLRPVRPHTSTVSLVSPTVVGFTGLAVLGRPGELIRPYLIARRANLSFASQLAVWAIERIFDLGAFTVLMVLAIFLPTRLRTFAATQPAYDHWLHVAGYLLCPTVDNRRASPRSRCGSHRDR
jgi:glycosyltransferase 2 family protein